MIIPHSNPGADSSTETIQAEIDALRAFGANQMPDKHKEIDLLAKAYKDLEGMGLRDRSIEPTDKQITITNYNLLVICRILHFYSLKLRDTDDTVDTDKTLLNKARSRVWTYCLTRHTILYQTT